MSGKTFDNTLNQKGGDDDDDDNASDDSDDEGDDESDDNGSDEGTDEGTDDDGGNTGGVCALTQILAERKWRVQLQCEQYDRIKNHSFHRCCQQISILKSAQRPMEPQ